MEYRREIDGLRALAVVPVVLFHAGVEAFRGGFVGVDVFFVISGYLITSIILAELVQNKFSLIKFYERRARRILPALFVVMLFCIPFAWHWLLPSDLKAFAESLIAVSIFGSNILFWRRSGYFDTETELKPLLHTWSLAVEEQYYVLFPIILLLAWRLGRRAILALLAVIAIVSLGLAQWGAFAKPVATFYLLPTRSWELLIGAFAAFYLSGTRREHANKRTCELAGAVGIACLLYSIFCFDKQTPFPSLYTLVPTVGTALIILFARDDTIVGKILGAKLLVGIGLVSYSAYLWHQPLLAFYKYSTDAEPRLSMLFWFVPSLVLVSVLSWKYIEMPFRTGFKVGRPQLFGLVLVISSIFVLIGVFGIVNNGYPSRLPPNLAYDSLSAKLEEKGDICIPQPLAGHAGITQCEFGDLSSSQSLILYGDSHAQAIGEELGKSLVAAKIKGLRVQLDGCEIVPQIHDITDKANLNLDCLNRFNSMIEYIKTIRADIVVASRWSFKMYPVEGEVIDMPSKNTEGGVERSAVSEYAVLDSGRWLTAGSSKKKALQNLIENLLSASPRVYLVYPTPEIALSIARVNFRYFKGSGQRLPTISIPHSDYQKRNNFVNQILDGYEGRANVVLIKPEKIFCDSFVKNRCVAQFDFVPFYYDDDHLSDIGARYIVDAIQLNFK